MKKRLREKKRLGEFKELGFQVRGDLRPGLSGNDLEAFADRLIDVVEARSHAFGGGAGRDGKLDGFVTRAGRGSATEEDRAALAAFRDRAAEIAHLVTDLSDPGLASRERLAVGVHGVVAEKSLLTHRR